MRKYLEVGYYCKGSYMCSTIPTSEVYLVNKIVMEEADEGKCEVKLKTCTEEEYKMMFD